MTTPYERLAALDKLVHEPARLAVLTALSACADADFVFLHRATGLSKGNLSTHLSKLEAGGLVQITKTFNGKTPHTSVALTDAGHRAIKHHWQQLRDILAPMNGDQQLAASPPLRAGQRRPLTFNSTLKSRPST